MSINIPPNIAKSLQIALEELKTIIAERSRAEINSIDYLESLLGIKPAKATPPPTAPPTVPVTPTPTAAPPPVIPPSLFELLNRLLTEGIKLKPYTRYRPIALTGPQGITKVGNKYDLQIPTDYILVVPSVETRITFDTPVTDSVPPTPAGGAVQGTIKARVVYYKATAAVPDSALPAELDIYALNYE